MAQLTVYIDDTTRRQIEAAARQANTSVSQWVKQKLTNALTHDWPVGYFDLFGSLAQERLERPTQPGPGGDVPREKL